MIMGGVRNFIETYTSGGAPFANITPNSHMMRLFDRRGRNWRASTSPRRSTGRRGGSSSASKKSGRAATSAGDPGFHGMRVGRTAAPGRSRPGLRNHQGQLRRLLVRRRGAADCSVVCIRSRAYSAGTALAGGRGLVIFFSMPTMPRGMKMMHRMRRMLWIVLVAPMKLGAETDPQSLVQRNRHQRSGGRAERRWRDCGPCARRACGPARCRARRYGCSPFLRCLTILPTRPPRNRD